MCVHWALAKGSAPSTPARRDGGAAPAETRPSLRPSPGRVPGTTRSAGRTRRSAAHGFRSAFRDWAAEETDHPREVIEAALAHVVQNKVDAAYACACLFTMLLRESVSGPMETGRREPFGPNCLLSRSWPGWVTRRAGAERRTAQPLTRLACGGYSGLFPGPGPAASPSNISSSHLRRSSSIAT